MSSREDFLRKMGLTADDVKAPTSSAPTVETRPVEKGEIPVDDSFIRTTQLSDTDALKSSPNNVTAKVAYRDDQLKKFRDTRIATMTREMGLEDGVQQHDDLAQRGNASHGAAQSYKAQLMSDFRKKKMSDHTNTTEL